jgi:hypothetical protein|tara:strand:+ start:596 stop:877 length:282 start_codon:yes stop_codon:yes gene_type:complete
MHKGRLVNILEASLIGFELIYVDQKKKLTKIYTNKDTDSYNVSISIDSANKIIEIEIFQINWDKDKTEITAIENYTDDIKNLVEKDIKKITDG